jgi:hypothetical protein
MTATIIITLTIALCVACWFLFDNSCDLAVAERNLDARHRVIDDLRARLSAATEDRHAVANSAMRGCPAVKWHRELAAGLPNGADVWYWRIRVAGEDLLLTDEQFTVARARADHLINAAAQK